ncbi:MAG: glycine--tRNA ligase subunit beta [Gammaproteobacteria bacterium]|nr:glycine--tRNA ligase subunit beta [Gammaproteobacteria bacterium]
MKEDLLIELGTEELPPKSLLRLSEAFSLNVEEGLKTARLAFGVIEPYATPRRLALIVKGLVAEQPDRIEQRRGPALNVAFDQSGRPTRAAEGFARSCGVAVTDLGRLKTDDGEWLAYDLHIDGRSSAEVLPGIVSEALASLPVSKRMRWGEHSVEFVRPVHWLVMLYGAGVVQCEILGLAAGRVTYGHRFHHPTPIELQHPNDYAGELEKTGWVIPGFAKRRDHIRSLIEACVDENDDTVLIDADLIDEVTALVEWPVAIDGSFDEHFLALPPEVLIASMKDHQKYFPVHDVNGNLRNRFIAICNIESRDPMVVRSGNERVIRPRLSDAEFFWKTDRTRRLETRHELLSEMVFEKRLGSLLDKTKRVEEVSKRIANTFSADPESVSRAAYLSRCDLLSEMVGEFPELQGTMGRYYALADGEPEAVCEALGDFYRPRFAGDAIPGSSAGRCIAFADKLDTLVGIFGIGSTPTGDKDPYALRRAALGLLRILIEGEIGLDLRSAISTTVAAYGEINLVENTSNKVYAFVRDRMRGYFVDRGAPTDACDAVWANDPGSPLETARRLGAVTGFREMDAAIALASANKRIANILKKLEREPPLMVDRDLLAEPEERTLADQYNALASEAEDLFIGQEYTRYMELLAGLRDPVDAFFDNVLVMCEDERLRDNRLALLSSLHVLFTRVADIGKLHNG